MAVITVVRKYLTYKLAILRLDQMPGTPFLKSTSIFRLCLQVVFVGLSPLPFLNKQKFCMLNAFASREICYGVNDIFHILQFYKLYFLVKAFITNSVFASSSSYRMCSIYGIKNSDIFVVKCMMKEVPLKLISAVFLSGILFFGYALRIAEAPLYLVDNTINLTDYFTCCWTAMLTMTTVGYGDYYPRTTLGRIIMFVCCVYGMVVVSLMVNFVSQELSLSQSELKAYTVIKRLLIKRDLKKVASVLLGKVGKYKILKNKEDSKTTDTNKILQAIVDKSKDHHTMNMVYKSIQDTNTEENIERNFALITCEVEELKSIMAGLKQNIRVFQDKRKNGFPAEAE